MGWKVEARLKPSAFGEAGGAAEKDFQTARAFGDDGEVAITILVEVVREQASRSSEQGQLAAR